MHYYRFSWLILSRAPIYRLFYISDTFLEYGCHIMEGHMFPINTCYWIVLNPETSDLLLTMHVYLKNDWSKRNEIGLICVLYCIYLCMNLQNLFLPFSTTKSMLFLFVFHCYFQHFCHLKHTFVFSSVKAKEYEKLVFSWL